MTQYIVTAYDHKDSGLQKRLAARSEHVALGDKLRSEGHYHMGVALLDEHGQMCGSVMVLEFETKDDLEGWLAIEPYITQDVWETWEVRECRVGPSFIK